MSGENFRVAAVVVSFNRKNLLLECLNSLLSQTVQLDKVILIDNKSTDGTIELLSEKGILSNPRVECTVLEENVGGAGGFTAGIERAVEQGYDWLWLMDDDAEPELNAFELCRPYLDDTKVVLVAPVTGDADGNPELTGTHRGKLLSPADATVPAMVRSVTPEEAASAPVVEFDACSFVGPFISARAVKSVGLPRREFFIHYDDLEYTLRLRKIGKLLLVSGAIIKHKQVQLVGRIFKRKTPFGEKERIHQDKLWSRYYGYRNLAWLIGQKAVPTRMSTLLKWHARLIIGVILYDDNKLSRLRFWNSALIDGLTGRFDNEKPRRWMPKAS